MAVNIEIAQGTSLPYPVAYTQNEYLKGVLAELNSILIAAKHEYKNNIVIESKITRIIENIKTL